MRTLIVIFLAVLIASGTVLAMQSTNVSVRGPLVLAQDDVRKQMFDVDPDRLAAELNNLEPSN